MNAREVIARANSRYDGYGEFITSLPKADAILSALEAAGLAIVPVEIVNGARGLSRSIIQNTGSVTDWLKKAKAVDAALAAAKDQTDG